MEGVRDDRSPLHLMVISVFVFLLKVTLSMRTGYFSLYSTYVMGLMDVVVLCFLKVVVCLPDGL